MEKAVYCAFVDVFNGEFAPQHLNKHLPELPGGQVVEERIDDGAEVEEAVGHWMEGDVAPEVGSSPAGLGQGGHHQTSNLVGKPGGTYMLQPALICTDKHAGRTSNQSIEHRSFDYNIHIERV
uniref:Uncharacterized protein n=1 Tax=Acanthochromis polyacanthus TaxID=80966 RepID=A0A3Q1GHG7_9TELE